jgi:hypothetical protein
MTLLTRSEHKHNYDLKMNGSLVPTVPAAACPLEAYSDAWHANDPRALVMFRSRLAQLVTNSDVRELGKALLRERAGEEALP